MRCYTIINFLYKGNWELIKVSKLTIEKRSFRATTASKYKDIIDGSYIYLPAVEIIPDDAIIKFFNDDKLVAAIIVKDLETANKINNDILSNKLDNVIKLHLEDYDFIKFVTNKNYYFEIEWSLEPFIISKAYNEYIFKKDHNFKNINNFESIYPEQFKAHKTEIESLYKISVEVATAKNWIKSEFNYEYDLYKYQRQYALRCKERKQRDYELKNQNKNITCYLLALIISICLAILIRDTIIDRFLLVITSAPFLGVMFSMIK